MSTATAINLIRAFGSRSAPSAFPNLGVLRQTFARDLQERVSTPWKISQGQTSLCGPASFMYCWIRRSPENYAQFVIDLYEKGEATIGHHRVKPGSDCRNYAVPPGKIAAVDWVSLAGLRDGDNSFWDYDDFTDAVGGITLPSGLAGWLKAAGFNDVRNRTNLVFDKNLSTLIEASAAFGAGLAVCLFVGSGVLEGKIGLIHKVPADHWVVLRSQVKIGGTPAISLLPRGDAVDADDKLLQSRIEFDLFTWGAEPYPVDTVVNPLTVATFLDFFYGFVSAK